MKSMGYRVAVTLGLMGFRGFGAFRRVSALRWREKNLMKSMGI
jgi:hypothetical protein